MSIVAGTGVQSFSGDGGPAVKAKLACPSGVALDTRGNLYLADHGNNRVRRVDVDGMIHSYAGAGRIPSVGSNAGNFGGDGGPAPRARFRVPESVVFDRHGNLYVADRDNGAVRRINPGGVITTVAGTGSPGYSGDGGPAARAKLNQPQAFAFDGAGNLYIADSANNRVRRVDRTGVITTVAGNGRHGYSGDGGPAVAASSQIRLDLPSMPTAPSTSPSRMKASFAASTRRASSPLSPAPATSASRGTAGAPQGRSSARRSVLCSTRQETSS